MNQDAQRKNALERQTGDAIGQVSSAKVFFAHQSVGENIVDGLKALPRASTAGLNIMDAATGTERAGGFFAHARLGANGDPKGKTDAFVAALEGGLGERVDVAFQKYCFADIDERTDVNQLFDYYREAMSRLHHEFPRVRIVHVTTPLVQMQGGWRAVVKKAIGRAPDHYEDNIARERFNELLRREYQGREPLFDLSTIEASAPDGILEPRRFRGAAVLELLPEYTIDGAHLNVPTARRVAAQLVVFLSEVVGTQRVGRSGSSR